MVQIPKKYNLDPEDAPLCACGCGQQVMFNRRYKNWSKFVIGHHGRLVTEITKEKMRVASRKRWGNPEDRFRNRVGKLGESGCMIWQGLIDKDGYGVMKWSNKMVKAHRVAWRLAYGEISDGSLVCHRCDTPACVNPDHLFLGSHAANHADRNDKGRQARGERSGRAKLTVDQVKAIRTLYQAFDYQITTLAKMFHVTSGAIHHIITRRSWKHL